MQLAPPGHGSRDLIEPQVQSNRIANTYNRWVTVIADYSTYVLFKRSGT